MDPQRSCPHSCRNIRSYICRVKKTRAVSALEKSNSSAEIISVSKRKVIVQPSSSVLPPAILQNILLNLNTAHAIQTFTQGKCFPQVTASQHPNPSLYQCAGESPQVRARDAFIPPQSASRWWNGGSQLVETIVWPPLNRVFV